jgi:hypothetical protein
MQCDQYREQLELIVDSEYDAGELGGARQHIRECLICRKNYYRIKDLDALIKQEMNAVLIPPQLVDKVINRIELVSKKKGVVCQLRLLATHSVENHQQVISCQSNELLPDSKLSLSPPALPKISPGLKLIGERKCQLYESNVDSLFYADDEKKISLWVICANDVDLENWDGRLRLLNQNDYHVAIWKDNNLIYSMVLKASIEKIRAMLRNC